MERKFYPGVLPELIQRRSTPCLSLYMPSVKAGPEVRQNSIRFSNLLREARRQCERFLDPKVGDALLLNAEPLLSNYDFWQHQDLGLALFATAEEFFYFKLPLPPEETVLVADEFLITPLLSMSAHTRQFFLLSLDLENPRFYEGTIYGLTLVPLPSAPSGIEDIARFREERKQLQHHAPTPVAGSARDGGGVFHAHDPSEQEKVVVKEYLYALHRAVSEFLRDHNAPLLIAGVEYVVSMYREINSYENIVEQAIYGSTAKLTDIELHKLAMEALAPFFQSVDDQVLGEFNTKHGSGLTVVGTDQVAKEAQNGRVGVLLLPQAHRWADEEKAAANAAAIEAMRTGAQVVTIPDGYFPAQEHMAAILRY